MNYFSSEFTEETMIGSNCNKVTFTKTLPYIYHTLSKKISD